MVSKLFNIYTAKVERGQKIMADVKKYLDLAGLRTLWGQVEIHVQNSIAAENSDRVEAERALEEKITALEGSITAICDAVYTDDRTAREFLYFLDDAIENISARSALIGAYMNRVESAVDAISVQKENIVSANSSIKDADVAEESSNYIKYQILQQSAATLLATANQAPSIALQLI